MNSSALCSLDNSSVPMQLFVEQYAGLCSHREAYKVGVSAASQQPWPALSQKKYYLVQMTFFHPAILPTPKNLGDMSMAQSHLCACADFIQGGTPESRVSHIGY